MAVHKRSLVESVLQRFPAISHAVVFLLAVLGPTYAPIGFVLYSVLVNFIILGVNCRYALPHSDPSHVLLGLLTALFWPGAG